jgi:hypothetical protein
MNHLMLRPSLQARALKTSTDNTVSVPILVCNLHDHPRQNHLSPPEPFKAQEDVFIHVCLYILHSGTIRCVLHQRVRPVSE